MSDHKIAILAGGGLWGMEDLFREQPGVVSTRVGYTGGSNTHHTYRNHPGHAEALEITYDPDKTDYRALLEFFFQIHDPTQKNRQGPDVGTSYRSAIFYLDDEQKRIANAYIEQLDAAHVFAKPIVTQLTPFKGFYRAENYHQDYAYYNPNNPYIQVCDRPKIAELKQRFPELCMDYKPNK